MLSLGVIDVIALPNAKLPFGTILIGTTLLGEVIVTFAVTFVGTISTSTISPFASYATNGTFLSVIVPSLALLISLTSTKAFTVATFLSLYSAPLIITLVLSISTSLIYNLESNSSLCNTSTVKLRVSDFLIYCNSNVRWI